MSSVSQFPPSHLIPDHADVDDTQATDIETTSNKTLPLALPAPTDATASLNSNGTISDDNIKFDRLGPMIINTDGTISRVHNWDTLTEGERERIYRLIVQRNKARIEKLKAQEESVDTRRD